MKKLITPRVLFFAFLSVLSIVFAVLIPPFQKPDEQVHFLKIMAMAEGKLNCTHTADIPSYQLSNSLTAFSDQMHRADIVMRSDAKFPLSLYKSPYPFRNDTSRTDSADACALPPLGYTPFVLAAWISLPFDNLLVTFFAIRIMAAILFLLSVYISLRVVSARFRYLVYLFTATPMVLHQATAVSYDAPLLYGVVVSFAWFTSLMDAKRVSPKALIGFTVCVLITSLVKPGHFFLYALPVVILAHLVSLKSIGNRIAVCVLGIGAILAGMNGVYVFINSNLFRPQMQVYAIDRLYFFRQLYATIGENSDAYLRGIAGMFGWLDTSLPSLLFASYWILLGIVFIKTVRFEKKPSSVLPGMFIAAICMVNIIAIFFRFAITAETPPAYAVISGMQGRYLLPFLPFMLYSFSLIASWIGREKIKHVALAVGGVIVMISLSGLFYQRYFDYRTTYKNPRYFETQLFEKPTIATQALLPYTLDGTVTYTVEPLYAGHKVGGFQFIMGNELDVTTPYRYRVSDRDCTRVVKEGFLDRLKTHSLSFLKGPTDIVYTQTFSIAEMEGSSYCVTLWPIMQNNSRTYLQLLGDGTSPLIEFLYIQK